MGKENQENFYFSGEHYDNLVRSKEFSSKRIQFYKKQKFGTYDEEPFDSDSNLQIIVWHKM